METKKYKMHLENNKGQVISQEYEVEATDLNNAREIVWDLIIGYELTAEGEEIICDEGKKQWQHE